MKKSFSQVLNNYSGRFYFTRRSFLVELFGTRVVNAHPELKQWGVGSPAKIPIDELITARGKYDPGGRMKLASMYPIVEGYKGAISPGYFLHWEDPMQFKQINASFSVSPFDNMPMRDRLHAKLQFKTLDWDIKYAHNGADFHDLFGPVERSPCRSPRPASSTRNRSAPPLPSRKGFGEHLEEARSRPSRRCSRSAATIIGKSRSFASGSRAH